MLPARDVQSVGGYLEAMNQHSVETKGSCAMLNSFFFSGLTNVLCAPEWIDFIRCANLAILWFEDHNYNTIHNLCIQAYCKEKTFAFNLLTANAHIFPCKC